MDGSPLSYDWLVKQLAMGGPVALQASLRTWLKDNPVHGSRTAVLLVVRVIQQAASQLAARPTRAELEFQLARALGGAEIPELASLTGIPPSSWLVPDPVPDFDPNKVAELPHGGVVVGFAADDPNAPARLVTACADSSLQVFDLTTGERLAKSGSPSVPTAVTVAAGRLLVGDADGRVSVWSLPPGDSPQSTWAAHPAGKAVSFLAAVPDGRLISAAASTARLWAKPGDAEPAAEWSLAWGNLIAGLVVQVGGSTLLVAGAMQPQLHIWDTATGAKSMLEDEDGELYVWDLLYDAPSGTLVSGSGEGEAGELAFWDLPGRSLSSLFETNSPISVLAALPPTVFSPAESGVVVAAGTREGDVLIATPGGIVGELHPDPYEIKALAFCPPPAGPVLAIAGADWSVSLMQIPARDKLAACGSRSAASTTQATIIRYATIHANLPGKLLTAGDDRAIKIWDLDPLGSPVALPPAPSPVYVVAPGPGGAVLYGGCSDGSIQTWDLASGKAGDPLPDSHSRAVRHLTFLPGANSVLVSGSDEGRIIVHGSGRAHDLAYVGHIGEISGVACLSEKTFISTATGDGMLKFWAIGGDIQASVLLDGGAGIGAAVWVPSTRHVVFGSDSGTIGRIPLPAVGAHGVKPGSVSSLANVQNPIVSLAVTESVILAGDKAFGLHVLDLSSGELLQTVVLDDFPDSIAVSRGRVYIPDGPKISQMSLSRPPQLKRAG